MSIPSNFWRNPAERSSLAISSKVATNFSVVMDCTHQNKRDDRGNEECGFEGFTPP